MPRQKFAGLRDQLDPLFIAMSPLLILLTVSILLVLKFLRRRTMRIMQGN